jgi:hypothetical protein
LTRDQDGGSKVIPIETPICPSISYILSGWTIGQISDAGIEEALRDADRIETKLTDREAHEVIGRVSAGRWLVVVRRIGK